MYEYVKVVADGCMCQPVTRLLVDCPADVIPRQLKHFSRNIHALPGWKRLELWRGLLVELPREGCQFGDTSRAFVISGRV
jgi:hypothetical protein